jgi:hypothetical protein
MTFYTSTLWDDNSFNCSGSENTTEHLPSFSQIYNIFNDILDGLSLWNFDENSYSLNISNENDKKHDNSKPIFKTELTKKKRGPIKIQESKNAEHNEWSYDNITSKIQVHYLNFIISFLNDCVFSFFGKKKFTFLNIDYKEKSKVTKAHLEKMKHSTILDILKNIDISNKYKHYDKDNNKINVESLINYFWFRKIFEMKYLELFLYYYNDEQPLKELTLFDKKVILSEKTKSFYDLLQKKEQLKERIIYFCKLIYLINKNDI